MALPGSTGWPRELPQNRLRETDRLYRSLAFGLRWESNRPLLPFADDPHPEASLAEIAVTFHAGLPPERALLHARHSVRFAADGFRFFPSDGATIDAFEGKRVEVYGTSAAVPIALFSTVAALLLAARGALPMHGSTVAQDGAATLICGPAGAGKSTSVARLIAKGARLVSDDLSILYPAPSGGPATVFAGRRGVRLFASAAEELGRVVSWLAPPESALHKVVVYPPRVGPLEAFPLTRIVVLGHAPGPVEPGERAAVLARHFFRRSLLREIPGARLRLAMLAIAARNIDVSGAPAL